MWKTTVQNYYKDLGLKFKLPKKGSEDYIKIREIYDKAEKPIKVPAPKKPREKKVKPSIEASEVVAKPPAKTRGRPRKTAIKTTAPPVPIIPEAVGPTHIFTDASEKPQRISKTKISKPRKSTALYKREENLLKIAESEINDDKNRLKKIEKLKKDILDAEEVTSFKEEIKTKKKKLKQAAEDEAKALEEESKMIVEEDPAGIINARREERLKKAEDELEKFIIDEELKDKKEQIRKERKAALEPARLPDSEPMEIIPSDDVTKEAFFEAVMPTVKDEVAVDDEIMELDAIINSSSKRDRDLEPTTQKKKRKIGGGKKKAAAQPTSISTSVSQRETKPRRLFVKF